VQEGAPRKAPRTIFSNYKPCPLKTTREVEWLLMEAKAKMMVMMVTMKIPHVMKRLNPW
jgi:hypothetical protein